MKQSLNKQAYSIADQIALLKQRGMLFHNETEASRNLGNISYYRLRGYWWDMQSDFVNHVFKPDTYFEDVIDRYNFDRRLRLILFDAIEHIEIALRTKMIHYLSLAYGSLWYLDAALFDNRHIIIDNITKTLHQTAMESLQKELDRSQEIFIKEHFSHCSDCPVEAWKALEAASLGTLSKLYKSLKHQLPEKAAIANAMGLRLHNELSGWLEAITCIRNIIAHHSRLWGGNMIKIPASRLHNPSGQWLVNPLVSVQTKKPFLIISCMIYLCNQIEPGHEIKTGIISLFNDYPSVPVYKIGFLNNWQNEPLWM